MQSQHKIYKPLLLEFLTFNTIYFIPQPKLIATENTPYVYKKTIYNITNFC